MSLSKPTTAKSRSPCDLPSDKPSKSFWHSEPSALLTAHRTTRELPQTADVVIIGSGMSGASVAHHLLNDGSAPTTEQGKGKDGYSVVMLEAREACWGATGRNGGHCQPQLFQHPHDPSIPHFELENFKTIQSLIETKKIDCEFVVQPAVRTFYSRSLINDIEIALLKIQETAPELAKLMTLVTDKAELAKLRVPTATGAVVTQIAARMWPYKFVARILEDLLTSTELNGSFNLQTFTPVECLAEYYGDRWTVKTPRGCIVASKVVLATNAYTSHLLPGFKDLIVPVRGQMSALIPLPSAAGENRLKTSFGFDGEGIDDYLIQRSNEKGGHLMFGGGRGYGGPTVGVADDSVIDEEIAKYLRSALIENLALHERYGKVEMDRRCERCIRRKVKCGRKTITESCQACIRHSQACVNPMAPSDVPASVPKPPELNATHEWTGIMGYSRDEHPWVGQVPDKPNLFVSAGFTGHGMPNTWLCGKAVAEMVQRSFFASSLRAADDHPERFIPMQDVLDTAASRFGVPKAYLVTEKRLQEAMELEDVAAVDWAEMERGRRRMRADRMPSGYA